MANSFENVTLVLVHGAWADGSCWRETILPLRQHGLRVTCAPDSPYLPDGRCSCAATSA